MKNLKFEVIITPVYNKWITNEDSYREILESLLSHEMYKGDMYGEVKSVELVKQIKTDKQ